MENGLIFAMILQTAPMQRLLLVFLFTCFYVASIAQFQVGVFGGISNYLGDLVDRPYRESKPAFGLHVGYQLSSRFNVRAGFIKGKVAGADSLNKKDLRLRNLNFQTKITEYSIIGEFNTFDLNVRNWSPYLFAGVAMYHFNPYTFDQKGDLVFLKQLNTEGQGIAGYPDKPYVLTQLAIPLGAGVKYRFNEHIRLAFEIGLRKLFTDYLDDVSGNYADPTDIFANTGQEAVDVSYRGDEIPGGNLNYPLKGDQRGSPKYKDLYYFTGFHVTYVFPSKNDYSGQYGRKKTNYGCPTVF